MRTKKTANRSQWTSRARGLGSGWPERSADGPKRKSTRRCTNRASCSTADACSSAAATLWSRMIRTAKRMCMSLSRKVWVGVRARLAPGALCSSRSFAGSPVGGCVGLISAGTGSADSVFMDASASGNDVFFITRDRLVPQDFDGSYDMYDAHVCTASEPCPASPPVSPPPCTTGDSCKPAPTPSRRSSAAVERDVLGRWESRAAGTSACGEGETTKPKRKTKPKTKRHRRKRAKKSKANGSLTGGVRR